MVIRPLLCPNRSCRSSKLTSVARNRHPKVCATSIPISANDTDDQYRKKLSALEKQNDGRLGIYAINTSNNQRIAYRANERFPLCSTAKVMAVSAILKQSEGKPNFLHKKIFFSKAALITSDYAPVTQKHLLTGMSLAELCSAGYYVQ